MNGAPWSDWPAPAKLNLFLRIVGRRPDGYHLLQTVFRLLDWGDTVRLRLRPDGAIRRVSGADGVPPEADLAVRAANLLRQQAGDVPGVDIAIHKSIPMGGGLGGGSSDAATVLVALNRIWGLDLEPDRLASLGLQLGADVPVFVRGHSAWAEGVGERLHPLRLPPAHYLVLDPGVRVSTQFLFQMPELTRNAAPATISSFLDGGVTDNVFAPLVRTRYAQVAAAMDWLDPFGPARLSGSGACVFLELATREACEEIAARCPERFKPIVASGVDVSPLLTRGEGSDDGA